MASRLIPKVNSKQGGSPCKEKHVVLLSPVGKIEISGCETGLHEIKLPKMSVLPSGRAESSVACEVCEGAEEMTEPLQQCTAWLRAYFCEPATTGTLPVPAFHHPLLQRDPHHHPVPPGDPQQRGHRQLRRGTPAEGVAPVPREAAEGEADALMRPLTSHATQPRLLGL
uniref:O-6-methylguanine-DNA methyltransferase n=1 Tax=Corvus moneduloides TaxID=1196302 RepID=A0A8U7N5D8_CORMO